MDSNHYLFISSEVTPFLRIRYKIIELRKVKQGTAYPCLTAGLEPASPLNFGNEGTLLYASIPEPFAGVDPASTLYRSIILAVELKGQLSTPAGVDGFTSIA